MDPIYPWIDPAEIRRLAEQLMMPNREPAVTMESAGFDDGFVGYAADPLPPTFAEPALPLTLTDNPASSLADRIDCFCDWLRHQFAATDIFILDHEGSVIFEESSHRRLHFLARSLPLTPRRAGTPLANVRVKIAAAAALELIPVETPGGYLVLGAVVPEPLPHPSVMSVAEALSQAASPTAE